MSRPTLMSCLLAAALASCATSGKRPAPAAAEPAAPLAVIDAHLHTNFADKPDPTSGLPDTKEQLAAEMRRHNVVGAVSLGHDGDPWVDLSDLGVVQCIGIGATIDPARIDVELASGRYRCIKVYLGYVHKYAADPSYEPVYRLAEQHRVPVVFHTGDTDSTGAKLKYADPLTVDEVAVDHPNVTFVLAHAGNPWIESAAEVAYKNRNVVIDGSAFLIGDLSRYPPETIDTYVVRPLRWIFGYVDDPTRLMFGTDWPLTGIGPYLEVFKRAIPKEHWQAVFHDNAARVYGFGPREATK